MALISTNQFLPEVFRTTTNQRFFGATMDQLVSDAANVPLYGYIGRTFSPTYKANDNYVPESVSRRKYYQLEPSVVVTETIEGVKKVNFTSGYLDILDAITNNNGQANNHTRLFNGESYCYDGHFDYDKFVNYNDYYWMPDGPAAVNVYANQVPYSATYTLTRNTNEGGFTVSGHGAQPNPQITLARGGNYTFVVKQPGVNLWIQSKPGVSGKDPLLPAVTTRQVFGVANNGTSSGEIRFVVPLKTAQDFYLKMPIVNTVDAAVDFSYTKIQNRLESDFLNEYPNGLDGINTSLSGKTFVFIGNDQDDSLWTAPAVPSTAVDAATKANLSIPTVIDSATRPSTWQITRTPIDDAGSDYLLQILAIPGQTIGIQQKVFIRSGLTYASNQFWVDNTYRFITVPNITADADYLYYQDANDPTFYGEIKLVDNKNTPINITSDVLGKVGYKSPNDVIFTNGLKVLFDSSVVPASYASREFYVDGVGTSITLTPVDQLLVPEAVGDLIDTKPDYITINRGSQDRNAWSRYNRWFHVDVLTATASYNATDVDYGPNLPGRRPIIEFDTNLQLHDYGTHAIGTVDVIDFTTGRDAFNDVEGQTTATIDGVHLVTGTTIVFANDYDFNVKNKVWTVSVENINGSNYINLVDSGLTVDANVNVLATSGGNKGKTFWYDGTAWYQTQVKSSVNQNPLFDLVDANGYSFADTTVYPNSTFAGTKIFSYKTGTGNNDTILGFPLAYQNFNNIGDIVFTNFYDTDTFTYDGGTVNCNSGYLIANKDGSASYVNNYVKAVEDIGQYQIFTKFFDGRTVSIDNVDRAFVQIDVLPDTQKSIPYIKVFLNNAMLTLNVDYRVTMYGVYYIVELFSLPTIGDKIDVLIFSAKSISTIGGYYEVPENLDLNPLNENFTQVTLGQVRAHYNKLIENTSGSKSLQDSYLRAQGGTLTQHSSPAIYSAAFLNDPTLNFVNSITLARKEYTRFKNKFLSLCHSLPGIDYNNPITGVDLIMQNINLVKNSSFAWYYSDMVPHGGNYNTTTYTVLNAKQTGYEIGGIFNNLELSNRAVLVYLNGTQLTVGKDYTFNQKTPTIDFLISLTVNDIIVIRDYFNTDGNYVPETPSKLGLYPKFEPTIFLDNTYQTPTEVIRGHDGSLTPVFGDFRDQFLLELEKRIYNNIKADHSKNEINLYDIIPGRFRTTEYSQIEFTQLLTQNFLQWVGANTIDYTTNKWYDVNNQWTWNYHNIPDVVDKSVLQGSWRAIYNYWFDTDRPNLAPWEMLGFGSRPNWWVDRYGPAPYTSGNGTLWEDLEAGYIWNNGTPYTDTRFVRLGLSKFIPVDTAGNLLTPQQIPMASVYSTSTVGESFRFGEQGPAETAWRRNSDYPYAVQLAVALAKPAKYFATQYDTSRYYKNPVTGHFSNANNQRITPSTLVVNGDTTTGTVKRTSGYINWIADSIRNVGIDPIEKINNYFKNLSVQLTFKVGGFTDKNLISVLTEQTSPGSTSASVIIPDDNYQVYFNKSIPLYSVTYSAVIVEKTINGYRVTGYDVNNPFFIVTPSTITKNYRTVTVDNLTTKLYDDSSKSNYIVPYGREYATIQQVADFLISYERYLIDRGFKFDIFDNDLQAVRNWTLSVQEFLNWAQQGLGVGTVLILNPTANSLNISSSNAMVDEITNIHNESRILDQNFVPIKNNKFNIIRRDLAAGNLVSINTVDTSTICYARLNMVQYEHILVFDNVSDFGDIIYAPAQGKRQYRLKLSGSKTGNWKGSPYAQGYVYSNPKIKSWAIDIDYRTGDIVSFNSNYYTAKNNIPATAVFDFAQWTQISSSDVQSGLLPSLGHNAQKFENFYDVDKPPQEENLQLFSAGLIGFRQRPYLSDLGISIPNQTKFYQGYITQKGTLNSITSLTKADFDNVQGVINTYEEWAFRVGTYGDVNNNQYREFILDQSIFKTNPVALQLTDTYSNSNVIVGLTSSNIYTSSNLNTISTTLYKDRIDSNYMADLPTAGYVNTADVDSQIFKILDASYRDILNVGVGHKIWTAKDPNGNWNVYRVSSTDSNGITLTYTLDSYAQLAFDNPHGFAAGDLFVLSGFNDQFVDFSGLYKVISTPNATSVVVEITNSTNLTYLIKVSPISSKGLIYSLPSAKIQTIANLQSAKPLHGWTNNDRVWVSNATSNYGWGVYTYNHAWLSNAAIKVTANTVTSGHQFGTSTRISTDTKYVYVGDPGAKQIQVFADSAGTYSANVTVGNTATKFGSVIESQGNLLIVGSDSYVHIYTHNSGVVTPLQSNAFASVTSIAMSTDKQWLYVGGANTVGVYTITGSKYQLVTTLTDTGSFGNVVKTNSNGTRLFVGAPTADNTVTQNGNVYVYNRSSTTFTLHDTLTSQYQNQFAGFGTSVAIDATGGNLFVGIPGSTDSGFPNGSVERYVYDSGTTKYQFNELINHPDETLGAFGSQLSISDDARILAVGSSGSATPESTTFDNNETIIDAGTTFFIEDVLNSGAVYLFEAIIDQTKPNQLVPYTFVQELETQVHTGDQFGSSVDITRGLIAVGSKGANSSAGEAHIFVNSNEATTWMLTRQQESCVDVNSINRTFIYNKKNNNILSALDFVDPVKGKVLNAVDRDIDYKRATDPALYNAGSIKVQTNYNWGPDQVGRIWWNLDSVRYIDYEQSDLVYRLNHWGDVFPGSSIDVYEWVESSVPPSQYVTNGGLGTPLYPNNQGFSTYGYVDQAGTVISKYYFWVKNLPLINTAAGKHNSVYSIAAAIENPLVQGIPYATVLRNDTVALYNVNNLLSGQNSVLHIGSCSKDAGLIHSEYALVEEGNPTSQLPDSILHKMIDSLAGQDVQGNAVPDPELTPAQAYGINIRPRQSMFIDRTLALTNYLTVVNSLLKEYPVVARRILTTMNSSETVPNPTAGSYSRIVDTFAELGYIDTVPLSAGYGVLVNTDSTHNNKWAIYTLNSSKQFIVSRVQSYKTDLYWDYIDWYEAGYDPTSTPDVTVDTNLDFGKLTLVANTYVKILNAGNNIFEVYYIDGNLNKNLIGIERGTIQIKTSTIPALELRQILTAVEKEILIDDIGAEFNQVFFLMVKYTLTEQKNLDWVFKTSFLSATQYIRKLEQFPSYIADNQNYYLDYINEVKPYRTVLREFIVDYQKTDDYAADITDFDLPPYWDANLSVYRSPSGEQSYDANIQSTGVNANWNNNYKYKVVDFIMEHPGSGYLSPPMVTIDGDGTGAEAYSELNGSGGVARIRVTKPGYGYVKQPKVLINGTGTGASALAVLRNVYDGSNSGHNVVRSIKTDIKFDRVSYTNANTFVFWDTITTANIGDTLYTDTVLVLNDSLYKLTSDYTIPAGVTFPSIGIESINVNSFNEANDRIVSFVGNVDLSLTTDGIDYPGVVVDGNTYVGTEYDTYIQSRYTDSVGVNPADIIVDGGAYIDRFSSHAPQELIPGRMFDSLNIQVFDANLLAFRVFDNMNGGHDFFRISADNTTELTSNLALTDTEIHVADATALPIPSPNHVVPGVIFVNGEKITFYRNYFTETPMAWAANTALPVGTLITYGSPANIVLTTGNVESNWYLTTGNVYGADFADVTSNVRLINPNSVGQIRRAVDGTSPFAIHTDGTLVVDSSIGQRVPTSANGNVIVASTTNYLATANVSYALQLTGNITANIGEYIVQKYANAVVAANLRVLSNVTAANVVPVIKITGNITKLAGNTITVNGTSTTSSTKGYPNTLGNVQDSGNVSITAGTQLTTANIWYTAGTGTPSNGQSLVESTTPQAEFLKASRGYTP